MAGKPKAHIVHFTFNMRASGISPDFVHQVCPHHESLIIQMFVAFNGRNQYKKQHKHKPFTFTQDGNWEVMARVFWINWHHHLSLHLGSK